jgi:hypothetical protein
MKKLIALLFAAISINAAAVEYQIAITERNETILFSDEQCSFHKYLNVAHIITDGDVKYACYGTLGKETIFFFKDGGFLRMLTEEIHALPRTDI